jgi:ATP synthase protein I
MSPNKPLPAPEPFDSWGADEPKQPPPQRWTAEQAAELRKRSPSVSPWRVVLWQLMASGLIALVALAVSANAQVGWSALYGGLTVALPAAVLARGMTSPLGKLGAVSSAMGFMVWEVVKIGLSVAMLMLAPQVVAGLSWPALLAGLILTMKVYWLAAVFKPKQAS